MKKVFIVLSLSLFSICSFAGNAQLFNIDEEAVNKEFSDLTALENYVSENNFLTLGDIQKEKTFDLSGLNVNSMGTSSGGDFVFQWEGFLWRFCCCPVGFFVIAVNKNKDYDQKLSYWIGVLVNIAIDSAYRLAAAPVYY